MSKVNLKEKLGSFSDYWNPRIIAELNGQHVKVVKIKGEFIWHQHDHEDELFLVVKGSFVMQFRDKNIELVEGECIVVPKGIEHRPVADNECEILLFEPIGTLNTGEAEQSSFTKSNLDRI